MVPEDRDYKVTDRRGGAEPEPGPDEGAAAQEKPPAGAPSPDTPPPPSEALPEIDFATFVLSMASSAVTHLQGIDDEGEQTLPPNLPLARQAIDILSLLQTKTKGNLTGEEERLLDHVVYDLRLQFVQAAGAKK